MPDAKQPIHVPDGPLQWLLALGGLLHTDQVEAAAEGDKVSHMTHQALANLRQALSDPRGAAPQATLLEGSSRSKGIIIVHRNADNPWRVWVWNHLPNDSYHPHGCRGEILSIKANRFIRWMAKDADAAMKTMQRILLAPDLQIGGRVW